MIDSDRVPRLRNNPQSLKSALFRTSSGAFNKTTKADLAAVHGADPSDSTPQTDHLETMRSCAMYLLPEPKCPADASCASRSCVRIARPFGASGKSGLATYSHASPGLNGLRKDCAKSARSLPSAESAKSSTLQDAPGIPSSARDHSLSPGSTHMRFLLLPYAHAGRFIRRRKHQVFHYSTLSETNRSTEPDTIERTK